MKRMLEDLGEGPSTKKRRRLYQDAVDANRTEFKAKYELQGQIGEGGSGSVFAGYRKADNLPVAIKYVPYDDVPFKNKVCQDGKRISMEVAIMLKLEAERNGPVGAAAPMSLLDWYDLHNALILVMERPVPCVDLYDYIKAKGGALQDEEAKIIMKQVVDAAKYLEDKCIFHRDIKAENLLIETGSDVPRVRVIDIGLGCFVKPTSSFPIFHGTPDHIPPECFCHDHKAGPVTVWQLGVLLFESINRQDFNTWDFLDDKLTIDNELPENCRDFMQECLSISPKLRPSLDELKHHPWLG